MTPFKSSVFSEKILVFWLNTYFKKFLSLRLIGVGGSDL